MGIIEIACLSLMTRSEVCHEKGLIKWSKKLRIVKVKHSRNWRSPMWMSKSPRELTEVIVKRPSKLGIVKWSGYLMKICDQGNPYFKWELSKSKLSGYPLLSHPHLSVIIPQLPDPITSNVSSLQMSTDLYKYSSFYLVHSSAPLASWQILVICFHVPLCLLHDSIIKLYFVLCLYY